MPIERVPPERDVEVIALLRRAFNGGPSWFNLGADPLDHYHWKVRSFPGRTLLQMVEDGDTLVGTSSLRLHRFLSQGREIWVTDGVDEAVDPAYQGRGITSAERSSRRLRIDLVPDVAFSLGPRAHPLTSRRLGRRSETPDLNSIETLVKLISPSRLIRGRVDPNTGAPSDGTSLTREVLESRGIGGRVQKRKRASAAANLLGAYATSARPTRRRDPWAVTATPAFDERFDAFWEWARKPFDLVQVRDRAYLNWRFGDARGGAYDVRCAEQDDVVLGLIATRRRGLTAIIADLLTLPHRPDVVRSLLLSAIEEARRGGVATIRCWLPSGHPYRQTLRSLGFVSYPTMMSFSSQPWGYTSEAMAFLSNDATRIHYTMSDSDHV